MAVDAARDGTAGDDGNTDGSAGDTTSTGGAGDEAAVRAESDRAGAGTGTHTGTGPGSGSGGTDGGSAAPDDARARHRLALAEFRRRRAELAAGVGLPAALAHSAGASRQWVSDELTRAARTVAERSREEGVARLSSLWRHTLVAVWAALGVLLLAELTTALAAGWTLARTAGLLAGFATAVPLSLAAYLHRSRGGVLAPVIGEDNRLSTSRTVAGGWLLLTAYSVLFLALELAFSPHPQRLLSGLELARAAGLLTVLALSCAVAVYVRRTVAVRVAAQRLQKVRADRPRAADLLTDDAGRGSFSDVQYVLVCAVALVFTAVRLVRRPDQLPDVPWGLAALFVVSAATYLAGKYAEGGRPVVLSVVRARDIGDLHAPIRTGDDIEIRGAGFVPPGAGAPDRLARMVVRVGSVHVPVPLIPTPTGSGDASGGGTARAEVADGGADFGNPSDATLVVPVPVEVEPGRVDVQVVTAAGVETNRYPIDVAD